MSHPRSVLIVDRSEDAREVLATVLRRRGLRTLLAGRGRQGLEIARRHHPDLIVLDLELIEADGEGLSEQFARQSRTDHTAVVMLGTVRRPDGPRPEGEFVAKPYHYGPLVRKIEEMLSRPAPSAARVA